MKRLLCLTLLLACKSETSNPDLEDVPALFAVEFCNTQERCLGPLFDALAAFTFDCEQTFRSEFENRTFPLWLDAVEEGTLVYNASQVDACLSALRRLECSEIDDSPAACDAIFEGQVAAGDPCAFNEECQEGHHCRLTGGCPGTCTVSNSAGENCERNADCVDGLECTDDGVCGREATADQGMPCQGTSNMECRLGLICVGAEGTTPGTCMGPDGVFVAAAGEACDLASSSPLCQAGFSCVVDQLSPPSYACVEESAPGGECRFGVPDPCPSGEYCADVDLSLGDVDGTCRPLGGEGAACTTPGAPSGFQLECQAGHSCVADMCRMLHVNGESCTQDDECYSGRCDNGTCAAPECG